MLNIFFKKKKQKWFPNIVVSEILNTMKIIFKKSNIFVSVRKLLKVKGLTD